MDANTIISLVGSLGFPVVACIALFYFWRTDFKDLTTAINNNTLVIQKLVDKLDKEEKDD